jgi:hypothetical protein
MSLLQKYLVTTSRDRSNIADPDRIQRSHLIFCRVMISGETRIRIGIDFDSTIAKIDLPWLERLNAARGTVYRPEDWSDWDLSFLRPDDRKLVFDLLTPDLYDIVVPYPGAPDAIRSLWRKGAEAFLQVLIAILTDGAENSSRNFSAADILQVITYRRTAGSMIGHGS